MWFIVIIGEMKHKQRLERIRKRLKAAKPDEMILIITHANGDELQRVTMAEYAPGMGAGRRIQMSHAGVPIANPIQGDMFNGLYEY